MDDSVKKAIIQMVGGGMRIDQIVEHLNEKGIKVTIDEVVEAIMSGSVEELKLSPDSPLDIIKWLISEQIERVNKLRGLERMSPVPLSETTNNIKLLADLVIKYIDLTRAGEINIEKIRRSLLFGE